MGFPHDPNLNAALQRRIERILAELERGAPLMAYMHELDGGGLPRRFRALYLGQHGDCSICRELMVIDVGRDHDLAPSLEHVRPRALGGRARRNLLLSHRICNSERHHDPATPAMLEFKDEVYRRLKAWVPMPASWHLAACPEIGFLLSMEIVR